MQVLRESAGGAGAVAMYRVIKYGRRYWAVLAPTGELVCVTLYRKGAEEVARRLSHS